VLLKKESRKEFINKNSKGYFNPLKAFMVDQTSPYTEQAVLVLHRPWRF
jgi:hypothetical protein